MNKNVITIITLVLAISIISYFFVRNKSVPPKNNVKTIAIFEPAIHPAMDEISQGFIDTITKNSTQHYEFKKYNANGNKLLMKSLAEEIVYNNVDLGFTIGTSASVMLKECATKQQSTMPIVFCAIDDPQKFNLVGDYVTGATEKTDYEKQITLLLKVMPNIKKIALVYDPSQGSGLQKDKELLEKILKTKKISLQSIEIQSMSEIKQKVQGFMKNIDLVMILKDHTAVSGLDSLINLCNRYKKPLFASDLNSGQKGAALAFGILEYDSGVEAAQKALEILEHGKKPGEIPVSSVWRLTMHINKNEAEKQGLIINEKAIKNNPEIKINI